MKPSELERTLTELDHLRLTALLDRASDQRPGTGPLRALADILDLADIVPATAIAPDIITMRSRVHIEDGASGARRLLTLSYPDDGLVHDEETVSVLSPLGAHLLGTRVGHVPWWQGPTGEVHRAKVLEVSYQPEAAGDHRL